ncbi:hypothetical protein [Streptomyces parvus]|uniref:hypothetical protein n=1 Tax=Streptomyces parvus TaxID=66428 RepID=UPI003645F308
MTDMTDRPRLHEESVRDVPQLPSESGFRASALAFTAPLRIELTRSGLLWFVPVLVGVGVAVAWNSLRPGVAYWPSATTAVNASVVITGPLVAGVATWLGSRERRRGLTHLRTMSSRSGWLFPAAEMAALLLWVVFSYGVVLLTVVLRTLFMGPSGHLGPSAVLAGAMGLCVHAAAGYLVGRCWSAKVAPPLVAICAFGITLYGSGQYGSPWYVLFPVLIDVPDPFSAWQPGLYWRQLLWLASLVALLVGVAFHAVWRSRALRVCVAVAAALAVLGGVLTWQLRGVYFQPGEPSFTYACRQDGIKVCVNPTFRAALPDLVTGFSDIAGKLDGTPGEFTGLEQRPRGVGGDASAGFRPIHMDSLGPGWLSEARSEFLQELVDQDACMDADEDRYLLTEAVASWIADDAVSKDDARASAVNHLRSLSPDESTVWMNQHFADFQRCALAPSDFTRSTR